MAEHSFIPAYKVPGRFHGAQVYWPDREYGWIRIHPPVLFGDVALRQAMSASAKSIDEITHAATSQPEDEDNGGSVFLLHAARVLAADKLREAGTDAAKRLLELADAALSETAFEDLD